MIEYVRYEQTGVREVDGRTDSRSRLSYLS